MPLDGQGMYLLDFQAWKLFLERLETIDTAACGDDLLALGVEAAGEACSQAGSSADDGNGLKIGRHDVSEGQLDTDGVYKT